MKNRIAMKYYLEGKSVRIVSWPKDVYVYLSDEGKEIVEPANAEPTDWNGYCSPLEDIDENLNEEWELLYVTDDENFDEYEQVEEYKSAVDKAIEAIQQIDSLNISQLEKDIQYIKTACKITSFDSINHDWIIFNTEVPEEPLEDYPLYIDIWNEHGSPWRPMMQHHHKWDDVQYYGGTNVALHMDENKKLWSHGCGEPFELLYKEITREEYVANYRQMAQKGVERELKGLKAHRLADDLTKEDIAKMY